MKYFFEAIFGTGRTQRIPQNCGTVIGIPYFPISKHKIFMLRKLIYLTRFL